MSQISKYSSRNKYFSLPEFVKETLAVPNLLKNRAMQGEKKYIEYV